MVNVTDHIAFGWQYEGTAYSISGTTITEWPDGVPLPTQAEVDQTVVDYQAWKTIMDEILRLEALETSRRIAESVLTDEGKAWLTANRDLIAAERSKL